METGPNLSGLRDGCAWVRQLGRRTLFCTVPMSVPLHCENIVKNEIGYARRANQKLACAEVLLSLPSADSDRFVVQSLVESVYLQLELTLGFYVAEVLARHGEDANATRSRSDSINLDRLTAYLRNPAAEIFEMMELKALLATPGTWFSHCVAVCQSLRHVSDQNARMKSSIFDEAAGMAPRDNTLIAIADAAEATDELSIEVAQSTLQSLREFIERNREAGLEC